MSSIRDRTLVLRILVPGLEARLRDKMKDMEEAAAAESGSNSTPSNTNNNAREKDVFLDLEGVTCEPTPARNKTLWNFHCDGASYPARLVNLPCPVEIGKTHDHAAYYKCVNIAQMLIVYEDDMALEEEALEKPVDGFISYHHSGLTPPMKRVVERRFAAREHSALAPPRAAVSDVEVELMELMEQIAKDEKSTKRNKVPSLTSATKVLEQVEEDVVEYEPWMDDYGRQPHGVEFDADDALCSLHPEVWLRPDVISAVKQADSETKRKKQQQMDKKQAKRQQKKLEEAAPAQKKGIASKKNAEPVDDITLAASSMMMSDFDLMGAAVEDDDFFGDLNLEDEDMNFDGVNL